MGYSVRVKPNDNFEKFRAKENGISFEKYAEKYLMYHVMMFQHEKKNIDMALCDLIAKIEKYTDQLIAFYQHNEKVHLTSLYDTDDDGWKEKGELIFSGWEFSRPCDIDIDSVKEYVIDKLFTVAAMTKSYDYYDDGEMFCHKQNDVQETIDYLREECEKLIDFKVLEEYGDADEKEEYSDADKKEETDNAKDDIKVEKTLDPEERQKEAYPCEKENEVLD